MCCLPSGIGVAVGLGPPARAADVAGVGVAVCCPQVLELLCAVFPQVLELLWDLAHLPVLPTSLVLELLCAVFPQVLELLCAVFPQVLELLWDLAHLPVLPTSLVLELLSVALRY